MTRQQLRDGWCMFPDCLGGQRSGSLMQMCGVEHADLGTCTRSQGHGGKHVACSLIKDWHAPVQDQWEESEARSIRPPPWGD